MLQEAAATKDITILDLDHPGAKDPIYRARRDQLATLAQRHRRLGLEPPVIVYTGGRKQYLEDRRRSASILCTRNSPATFMSMRAIGFVFRPITSPQLSRT